MRVAETEQTSFRQLPEPMPTMSRGDVFCLCSSWIYGLSGTAASGVATTKLKLSSIYR